MHSIVKNFKRESPDIKKKLVKRKAYEAFPQDIPPQKRQMLTHQVRDAIIIFNEKIEISDSHLAGIWCT